MTPIGEELKLVTPNSMTALAPDPQVFDCEDCQDSGRIWFTEQKFGKTYNSFKPCVCALEKKRQKKLSEIPPAFRSVSVGTLRPDTRRHARQPEIVEKIVANPTGSFFFAGKFGCGKTHLLYALYREAVMRDQSAVVSPLSDLMEEFKRMIDLSKANQPLVYPRITAEKLSQEHTKYAIFLDDIDKVEPTKWVCEQTFRIFDAIFKFQHQLVVTTNLPATALLQHFSKGDARYGGSMVRRLVEGSTVVEMF
jgi:DNA replication protein DnaC